MERFELTRGQRMRLAVYLPRLWWLHWRRPQLLVLEPQRQAAKGNLPRYLAAVCLTGAEDQPWVEHAAEAACACNWSIYLWLEENGPGVREQAGSFLPLVIRDSRYQWLTQYLAGQVKPGQFDPQTCKEMLRICAGRGLYGPFKHLWQSGEDPTPAEWLFYAKIALGNGYNEMWLRILKWSDGKIESLEPLCDYGRERRRFEEIDYVRQVAEGKIDLKQLHLPDPVPIPVCL